MITKVADKQMCYLYNKCRYALDGTCQHNTHEHCDYLFKIDWLLQKSQLSDRQIFSIANKITLGKEDNGIREQLNSISRNIRQFVESGGNLYLYSEHPGNGKTTCAIRLLQEYIKSVWTGRLECRALFVSVSKVFYELKLAMNNEPSDYLREIRDNITKADLVVWDDICTTSPSSYEYNTLMNWINCRVDSGYSNIYTSNMTPEQISKQFDDRFASRVCNMSVKIRFRGSDIRNEFGGYN